VRKALGLVVLLVGAAAAPAADVPDLIKKLGSKDNEERRDAANQLAEAGKAAKPAVKALTKALKDKDRFVRRYAAQALGNVGPDAKGSIKDLAALLEDDHQNVREAAVQALAKMGPSGVPALTKAMKGTSTDVQEGAVKALADAGGDAIDSLVGVIKDEKLNVSLRRQAVDAVVKMEAKTARKAVSALLAAAKSPRGVGQNVGQFRARAITALGTLATPSDKAVVSYLDSVVKDEKQRNVQLKNACLNALKRIQARKG
jgi:HEAT repeat protein